MKGFVWWLCTKTRTRINTWLQKMLEQLRSWWFNDNHASGKLFTCRKWAKVREYVGSKVIWMYLPLHRHSPHSYLCISLLTTFTFAFAFTFTLRQNLPWHLRLIYMVCSKIEVVSLKFDMLNWSHQLKWDLLNWILIEIIQCLIRNLAKSLCYRPI